MLPHPTPTEVEETREGQGGIRPPGSQGKIKSEVRGGREKKRKLSSAPPAASVLRCAPRSPVSDWGRRDNWPHSPLLAFQTKLLFLLSIPTLQEAPQTRARAAPARVLRCNSHVSGCFWNREGLAALGEGAWRAGAGMGGAAFCPFLSLSRGG